MADFMGLESEAESFGKRRHLGHRDHLAASASQDDDVSVVDHHPFRETAEVTPGVSQKDFAIKALEGRKALKEHHSRIAQYRGGGLYDALLTGDIDLMRRGVVLQLLGGFEVVAAHGQDGCLPDSMPAAEGGERLIGHGGPAG